MLLKDLMKDITVNPDFEGVITNDDNVLAVNVSDPYSADTSIGDYAVVQSAIEGVDAQLNAESQDKQYIRAGKVSNKVATQRTFKATGDRYIGDDFQDFAFSFDRMYGVGQKVVTDYVWFNMLNGKGEQGKCAIMVNSDGSGNAGETAGIDVELKKTAQASSEFTYSPAVAGSAMKISTTTTKTTE